MESSQDSVGNGVMMHDYLDWQRTAAEAEEFTAKKVSAGAFGNHQRWHVAAGRWSQDCKFCVDDGPPKGSQTPSQVRSQVRPADASQMGSQVRSQNDRREEKRREGYVVGKRSVSNVRAPRCPEHAPLPPDAWVPPCGPCASLRSAATAQVEADRERAELCAASGRCDGLWLLEYPFGPPVEPAVKCGHRPHLVHDQTG